MSRKAKEMQLAVRERIVRRTTTIVKPYTLAEVYVAYRGREARFVGLAKQGPKDAWDAVMGETIAEGRAIAHAARVLKEAVLLAEPVQKDSTWQAAPLSVEGIISLPMTANSAMSVPELTTGTRSWREVIKPSSVKTPAELAM